jgi:hypothetical protein
MPESKTEKLTAKIPAPAAIRQQLADNLQESKLLRQLLRVAERAHKLSLSRETEGQR